MGRKKTKAEKIQQGITKRLNKMEEAGINSEDINLLRNRTRELYELGDQLEKNENTYLNKFSQIKELLKDI
ncbi:MAG: hypothetical protein ABSB91_01465 [Sedimentisphaerales bacterium]|jgi:acyl-[acyl carrier protein]--UDP-N-acetylglucosamine O-acyltransferase